MSRSLPLLLCSLLLGIVFWAGCPGMAQPLDTNTPPPPAGDGGGTPVGGDDVRINLTLQGTTGTETNMAATVFFGNAAVSRADTNNLPPQVCQAGPQSVGNCSFGTETGQVATIIAVENPGGVQPVTVVSPPNLTVPTAAAVFTSFGSGCSSQPEPGVCVVNMTTTRNITINYTRMQGVTLQQLGAGAINVAINAPTPLLLPPVQQSPLNLSPTQLGLNCVSPAARSALFAWLPPGSTITFTAVQTAGGPLFRGWDGACAPAGVDPTCALTVTDTDLTAGARFQYFNCTALGSPCSAFNLDPTMCMLVEP